MTPVEALWVPARDRYGRRTRSSRDRTGVRPVRDRRRPSPGITAVLHALADGGATHGREVARRAGQSQPNVTSRWLPKLRRLGFVAYDQVDPALVKPGRAAGGRPARVWRLTSAGRELVAALRAERDEGAVA